MSDDPSPNPIGFWRTPTMRAAMVVVGLTCLIQIATMGLTRRTSPEQAAAKSMAVQIVWTGVMVVLVVMRHPESLERLVRAGATADGLAVFWLARSLLEGGVSLLGVLELYALAGVLSVLLVGVAVWGERLGRSVVVGLLAMGVTCVALLGVGLSGWELGRNADLLRAAGDAMRGGAVGTPWYVVLVVLGVGAGLAWTGASLAVYPPEEA
jgi:hypothetical protein